jgi:hypothetical protein
MIDEIKHMVHSLSLLPLLIVHFLIMYVFLTKTTELDIFRLGVYKVVIFKNRRKLKFSGTCVFCCELMDS